LTGDINERALPNLATSLRFVQAGGCLVEDDHPMPGCGVALVVIHG
jgi:hypothetical protein